MLGLLILMSFFIGPQDALMPGTARISAYHGGDRDEYG